MFRGMVRPLFPLVLLASAATAVSFAQKLRVLHHEIDDSKRHVLSGNVRPEATVANDRGAVDPSTAYPAMQLVIKRSPESQTAFEQYVADLQNPASPKFHHWLTNAQIGQMFGPADEDFARVTDWLTKKGFTINSVSPDETVIEFGGTAGLIEKAFHASIHNLNVNGVAHTANVNDPEIPEALAPMIGGIASLHDFSPHPANRARVQSAVHRNIVGGNGYNILGAADLATIYNFNPLFKSGISGRGQTIVVIEDTDLFSQGDFAAFRKSFGLTRPYPYGTLTETHPTGTNTCTDPGVNGDDGEDAIDVEWASAAAPNAAIISASCADLRGPAANFGGFNALANLLQSANPPKIVSISYGESESLVGAAGNLYINNLYLSAVAQGVSLFVSSGDEGAASSDANATTATHGITVSGFTSTPYNVSVGGTDFAASFLGETSTYFSSTNGPSFQTAKSYIPEIPWNDSCASQLIYLSNGYSSGVTFCNSALAATDQDLTTASGSGGPSNCATGAPATRGVAGGTCAGYLKPVWQTAFGVPHDGVRCAA